MATPRSRNQGCGSGKGGTLHKFVKENAVKHEKAPRKGGTVILRGGKRGLTRSARKCELACDMARVEKAVAGEGITVHGVELHKMSRIRSLRYCVWFLLPTRQYFEIVRLNPVCAYYWLNCLVAIKIRLLMGGESYYVSLRTSLLRMHWLYITLL
jgi:hypothetical protein